MAQEIKTKALDLALSQIEKQFGKGSVIRLGGQPVQAVPSISTGSISVDFALGIGGFPRGRISEIFAGGLHEYLTDFLESMEDLSEQIQASFFSSRVVE